jgi:sulfate/thiosulfate transport system substrate-binding protein
MWIKGLIGLAVAALVAAGAWLVLGNNRPAAGDVELLNVSYDPTRELWHDLNAQFIPRYEKEAGTHLTIHPSHGGSGTQARAVADGLAPFAHRVFQERASRTI